jgi:hypothetical protein
MCIIYAAIGEQRVRIVSFMRIGKKGLENCQG